jgi:quercetin dioxygenase-like cupin family protein
MIHGERTAPALLGSNLGFFGNIYVRHLAFEQAGIVMDGHSHQFDHVTLVSRGAVEVVCLGKDPRRYTAPAFIQIPAGVTHMITAIADDTECWCIFAVRDLDGRVIDDPHAQPVTGF